MHYRLDNRDYFYKGNFSKKNTTAKKCYVVNIFKVHNLNILSFDYCLIKHKLALWIQFQNDVTSKWVNESLNAYHTGTLES